MGILADLNACSKREILDILHKHGEAKTVPSEGKKPEPQVQTAPDPAPGDALAGANARIEDLEKQLHAANDRVRDLECELDSCMADLEELRIFRQESAGRERYLQDLRAAVALLVAHLEK